MADSQRTPGDAGSTVLSMVRSGATRSLTRTPLADAYAVIGFGVCVGAMLLQRPAVLGLAAPFIVAVVWGFAAFDYGEPTVEVRIAADRVIEGDEFDLHVDVTSSVALPRLDIELRLGDGLAVLTSDAAEGTPSARSLTRLAAPGTARVSFRVRGQQWGPARLELLQVRVTDRFGLFSSSWESRAREPIRIALPDHRLREPLEANRFRRIVGSHLSNARGEGLEIADIRPLQPGDSLRNVNWRISNRRQEPWVTLRHPDRSATLILVVDADDNSEGSILRRSTSGALALANTHLAIQDRVGLLVVGRNQRWIAPKLGRQQMYRIADALVAVGNTSGASMRQYRSTATQSIPSNAIVVVLSPLTDPLIVPLIAEVRSRGIPVSVLQPEQEGSSASSRPRWAVRSGEASFTAEARRLAAIEHQIGIEQLRSRQVTVVPWPSDVPAETAVEGLGRMSGAVRRSVRAS